MATTKSLHYVGNQPRSNPDMFWRVTSQGQYSISFFYFASLEEAVAVYPEMRDQAIAFHLEHAQRELNDYAAPGCDDLHTIRLLNARLTACRELLANTPLNTTEDR